jgi:hypothetical protein
MLEQVAIAGNMGTADDIAGLVDATQTAWTAYSAPIAGWRVVDAFARTFEGSAIPDALLPTQLMTQANAGDLVLDGSGHYVGVADDKEEFSKLWKVA